MGTSDPERARRLAEALRTNLRRRKAQARDRGATSAAAVQQDDRGECFELLARGFYLKGLLVDGDDVWFSDVVPGGVRRPGSEEVLLKDRLMIGGLLLNADGGLLIAGGGEIAWLNPATGASGVLAEGFGDNNAMYPDGSGGIVFCTLDLPAIRRGERPGTSSIRRLSPYRSLSVLRDGLAFANSIALGADGTTLYFSEGFAGVCAFPVGVDLALGEPRVLADKPDCGGMALDAEGNIWVTGLGSDHLLCLTPDGREVRRVALPGNAATSLCFGGADMRDLYVNVVDPAAARALREGRAVTERSSVLYRTRSPVPGAPIARTAFRLDR